MPFLGMLKPKRRIRYELAQSIGLTGACGICRHVHPVFGKCPKTGTVQERYTGHRQGAGIQIGQEHHNLIAWHGNTSHFAIGLYDRVSKNFRRADSPGHFTFNGNDHLCDWVRTL